MIFFIAEHSTSSSESNLTSFSICFFFLVSSQPVTSTASTNSTSTASTSSTSTASTSSTSTASTSSTSTASTSSTSTGEDNSRPGVSNSVPGGPQPCRV